MVASFCNFAFLYHGAVGWIFCFLARRLRRCACAITNYNFHLINYIFCFHRTHYTHAHTRECTKCAYTETHSRASVERKRRRRRHELASSSHMASGGIYVANTTVDGVVCRPRRPSGSPVMPCHAVNMRQTLSNVRAATFARSLQTH